MDPIGLYNEVNTPYFGVLIAIVMILPSILMVTIFKPKNKIKDNKKEVTKLENIFKIIENITRIGIIVTLCLSKNSFDILKADVWFGIMLFFFILYYELFIKYIFNGREYELLYKPFVYIKVPMAIFPAMGLIFAGIWGKNIILIIFAIIFAITHIYNAYKYYMRNFKDKNVVKKGEKSNKKVFYSTEKSKNRLMLKLNKYYKNK